MKITKRFMLLPILLAVAVLPALAEEPGSTRISYLKPETLGAPLPPPAPAGPGSDEQLQLRTADFAAFAREKVQEMNRNLLFSREHMQIRKEANGSYRATYHQIDDKSLSSEVSRSRVRTAPYVAVLSYSEQIYAASCATPEDCARQQFLPVDSIPNRHIFTYSNGSWN